MQKFTASVPPIAVLGRSISPSGAMATAIPPHAASSHPLPN